MEELKRLNKFISESGYCSRREADKLIEKGLVTINGLKAEMGSKVSDKDEVLVNQQPLKTLHKKIYIALNKPVGITCTTDLKDPKNIIDFMAYKERIFPIGRLDKHSEGLIFLTNDGDIVNKILRAGNQHEKEYVVRVDRPFTDAFIKEMQSGVPILDTVTLPCKVTKVNHDTFNIILTQGLNRQIRRMCETLGYEVKMLRRIRIMNVDLKGLDVGMWRYLTKKELQTIMDKVASSVKTEEASKLTFKPSPFKKESKNKGSGRYQPRGKAKPTQKSKSHSKKRSK